MSNGNNDGWEDQSVEEMRAMGRRAQPAAPAEPKGADGLPVSAPRLYADEEPPEPAAPAVSWRDHVEQRLHSWRSTTMNADGDCISLSDCLNLEAVDDLIDFVCDESAGPAAPADAAPSVAPEPQTAEPSSEQPQQ